MVVCRSFCVALSLSAPLGCLPPSLGAVSCEEIDGCTTGGGSPSEGETPTTGGALQTVTGDGVDDSSGSTSADAESTGAAGTTSSPAEPPVIVDGVVIPDFIADNGVLAVEVTTEHADGVRMLLGDDAPIELKPGRPGEFVGEIAAFTELDNGKHTAVLTPWRDALAGEAVAVDYVIALPPRGSEIGWQAGDPDVHGDVAAIDVLPDGRPVEFGTYQEMDAPRCYLRLRTRKGEALAFEPVLAGAYCRAIDLKIDRETGFVRVLVERESGDDTVWWAGESAGWGKGLKNIGTGAVGDTALALADRPDMVAVCGSRAVGTNDKLDALAVLLRPNQPAEVRVFDYWPSDDIQQKHQSAETARDCVFAGDQLVIVGEARGRHDQENFLRDRLMLIELDIAGGEPAWTIAGMQQGVQTRAIALDLDDKGRYHLAGHSCADTCEPAGELWTYAPGGKLVEHTSLGPLGSAWFGPHDIAWSPAGYAVVALGELQGQAFVFKVQAFGPGDPLPLWTFLPNDKQGLQLALAVAVGPFGEVYAGGIGADDHPAFARIGS